MVMLHTACAALRVGMFCMLGLVHFREHVPFAVVDAEPG